MGEPRLVAILACVVAAVVLAIGVNSIVVTGGGYGCAALAVGVAVVVAFVVTNALPAPGPKEPTLAPAGTRPAAPPPAPATA